MTTITVPREVLERIIDELDGCFEPCVPAIPIASELAVAALQTIKTLRAALTAPSDFPALPEGFTPGPWGTPKHPQVVQQIDEDGRWGLIVADCRMTDEGEANAALIVLAVNYILAGRTQQQQDGQP